MLGKVKVGRAPHGENPTGNDDLRVELPAETYREWFECSTSNQGITLKLLNKKVKNQILYFELQ